jgi:hypothetical protein
VKLKLSSFATQTELKFEAKDAEAGQHDPTDKLTDTIFCCTPSKNVLTSTVFTPGGNEEKLKGS